MPHFQQIPMVADLIPIYNYEVGHRTSVAIDVVPSSAISWYLSLFHYSNLAVRTSLVQQTSSVLHEAVFLVLHRYRISLDEQRHFRGHIPNLSCCIFQSTYLCRQLAPALAVTLAFSRPSSVDDLCACALGLDTFPLQQ
ncbi:hypothetical protein BHE74_00017083 [Ensete ventricosum]|nr:hypothetical protein BHE74_00017083 [Ensete ventricosum]RZS11937.1 hypothetical protein BHM03_00043306 [Ensete ventricosum]